MKWKRNFWKLFTWLTNIHSPCSWRSIWRKYAWVSVNTLIEEDVDDEDEEKKNVDDEV